MYKWTYQTELGAITIGANDTHITYLKNFDGCSGSFQETDLIKNAFLQLVDYLTDSLREFDLPLDPGGTQFQRDVWFKSCEIPYGTTITYTELALRVNRPSAIRAAGAANGANPIYIIIPCHRIIGANGCLTGYGGGLEMKKFLLELEGAIPK